MVYVTNEARQALQRFYSKGSPSQARSLRLTDLGHDAIGIDVNTLQADDDLVENRNGLELRLEHQLASRTSGISIDAYETPEGQRLIISKEVFRKSHATVTVSWVTLPPSATDIPDGGMITG